jgi:hypothetical protein
MKNLVALSVLVLVAAAFTFVTPVQPARAVPLDNAPSVTGHGNLTIAGGLQTASFHAVQHQDGTITGSLVVKSRAQDVRIFADIDCLRIVLNTGILSGVVTQSNNSAFPEGNRVWFRVVDNGEGANYPPDMMTDIIVFPAFPPVDCNANFNVALMPIEAGNIQVHQ